MSIRSVCVFCGARDGVGSKYAQATRAFARTLAANRIELVYGGASVGLMGMLADTVLAAGGECIGVIPQDLVDKEIAHAGLTRLEITRTLSERKNRMLELSDAFVALPGGAGTLDELSELWTSAQLGIHQKPLGVLNCGGYFDLLLRFMDHAVAEGFLDPPSRNLLRVEKDPQALIDALTRPPVKIRDKRGFGDAAGCN
jgi:uncharacterized protein (TIGR00730 family)